MTTKAVIGEQLRTEKLHGIPSPQHKTRKHGGAVFQIVNARSSVAVNQHYTLPSCGQMDDLASTRDSSNEICGRRMLITVLIVYTFGVFGTGVLVGIGLANMLPSEEAKPASVSEMDLSVQTNTEAENKPGPFHGALPASPRTTPSTHKYVPSFVNTTTWSLVCDPDGTGRTGRPFSDKDELNNALRIYSGKGIDALAHGEPEGGLTVGEMYGYTVALWDVSQLTDLSRLRVPWDFNEKIGCWNVSQVKNMSNLFSTEPYGKKNMFNQDLSNWDVSSVIDFSQLFQYASNFNQDLSSWNTSSAKDMSMMFSSATNFDHDISNFDVSSVTDMRGMFYLAAAFNQDISGWETSSVTNMRLMFYETSFNQSLSTWDTSSVQLMDGMFLYSYGFNGDISLWNTSSVSSMSQMFAYSSFNGDIGRWDVGSVTDLSGMFQSARYFDRDISSWNVSSVGDLSNMFQNAGNFDQNLCPWGPRLTSLQSQESVFAGSLCESMEDPTNVGSAEAENLCVAYCSHP